MAITQMQRRHGSEPRQGYGETWAKTILMGDHSVVYGYPAVAVPLETLKMHAWASSTGCGGQSSLRALGYYGPLEQAPVQFAGLLRAIQVAKDFAGCPEYSFDIITRSDFPAGRGLGSSAAASGAVIRAVLDACGLEANAQQLASLTNEAEIVTHGHPSGLDAATTSGEHPVLFVRGDMQRVDVNLPAYLVIADSGVVGSTKEAVEGVRGQYEHDRRRVGAILESLGALAQQSADDLEQGGLDSLGRRMDAAHSLLAALHVSHPVVDRLVQAARSGGALGAKLTGGGLGGCIIALAPDGLSARRIRRSLTAAGAPAVWIHPLNQLDMEVGDDDSEAAVDMPCRG
ncbi:mevalonate kinase [Bifidobacterium sp.]|uniref:mevalonate kinase n=1 Tax=Bifidobacterium sp. TaxID=41200 RepID=UPI0025C3EA3B|nr:mevalonate kinase [Bifidobacterium sp.]MCH4209368.1 mevalonate kinase [Bifidobacterium sp.]MCI1225156.1 mevalonate kinase [Bifidobacterium sp.]